MLEPRLNRGRPPLVVLPLAVLEGMGRPGASIPSAVVGATRVPLAFSLLTNAGDAARRPVRKAGMNFDFFFSVSDAYGDSVCAARAVLVTTVAAANGGCW